MAYCTYGTPSALVAVNTTLVTWQLALTTEQVTQIPVMYLIAEAIFSVVEIDHEGLCALSTSSENGHDKNCAKLTMSLM